MSLSSTFEFSDALQDVLPVRASAQRIHAFTRIRVWLPVRAIGQFIHDRTMLALILPVRAIGQGIHVRKMTMFVFQHVRVAIASMPAR